MGNMSGGYGTSAAGAMPDYNNPNMSNSSFFNASYSAYPNTTSMSFPTAGRGGLASSYSSYPNYTNTGATTVPQGGTSSPGLGGSMGMGGGMPTQSSGGGGGSSLAEGTNLYVVGLPPDADDSLLYRLFTPFGSILSVKIGRNETGSCRGFGFVRMKNIQEATNAISGITGRMVGLKPLAVTFKKDKVM
eukprot:TRINITY_DN4275_c0_g1_i4.p1 TRINITY_DN4275_c0_g1~~TRINITY_DN4275_c0_g1_i4.p1  ORF type:complete len:189 (+),score=29.65 TRINITY_DN4275_c0_g1_i4:166-732(+)